MARSLLLTASGKSFCLPAHLHMKTKLKTPGWDAYLLGISTIGALAGTADAAITVTLYGPSASTTLFNFATVSAGYTYQEIQPVTAGKLGEQFERAGSPSTVGGTPTSSLRYFKNNAVVGDPSRNFGMAGDDNYVFFDQDNNGSYESVVQFNLNNAGGGYLVAKATSDTTPFSIAQASNAIAAVPETSSALLMALGATGLLARRRRSA